jgi:hypothetical protein
MRKLFALATMLASVAGAGAGDTLSDAVRAELARERRRLTSDASQLTEVTRRLEVALSDLQSSSRAVSDAASRTDAGSDELVRREEAVAAAEQQVRALLERRRLLADRVAERRRTVAILESEARAKTKPSDVLSGRWSVVVEPGEQRGTFRMSLDGALVSGDYSLEGGDTGSLRGTLTEDRVRLERVDSRHGFVAVFHGRLARDGSSIVGTWEATTFGSGGVGSGRWRAQPIREEAREESP